MRQSIDSLARGEQVKNHAAVELGRLGGLKGGVARAQSLSPERRREIAINAAKARWDTSPSPIQKEGE